MAVTLAPRLPWAWIGLALVLAAGCVLAGRGLADGWRVLARARWVRGVVLALSALGGACLCLALWNPALTRPPAAGRSQLIVVLDVSDSMLRAEGGWPAVRDRTRQAVAAVVAAAARLASSITTILTVRSQIAMPLSSAPLASLPAAITALSESDFAAGAGTNLAAGLERARDVAAQAAGQAAVLLVSDGLETDGDALAAARLLAEQGTPVYVLPISSSGPDLAITAADVPRHAASGATTYLRGMLYNSRQAEANARLAVEVYGARPDPLRAAYPIALGPDQWQSLRQPVIFQGLGLQALDVVLTPAGGRGAQSRRFFTHVTRLPRLLAAGGDLAWLSLLPADAFTVEAIQPAAWPTADQLAQYDVVALSDVAANDFSGQALPELAAAVRDNGLGLMMINGGHEGRAPDTPTVLMSYNGTPIESLLPVTSGKRPESQEPPPNVVILIDTSGSMSGWPLDKSKEIATYVVKELLRRQDRVTVLAFTTGSLVLAKDVEMSDANRQQVTAGISQLQSGGGTSPREALAAVAGLKLKNCGLVFISDGGFGFDDVTVRPECRATVFAIGGQVAAGSTPLSEIADPFPVLPSFSPASITIPYFSPEQRNKFFEPGRFTPLAVDALDTRTGRLTVPQLSLEGAAVTYPKDDAEVVAVRPRLTDPVLAYGPAGQGYVGVFTTRLPAAAAAPGSGQALESWLAALAPYMARERYDFQVHDAGSALEITVALAAPDGRVPDVRHLSARLQGKDMADLSVNFTPDAIAPATFTGRVEAPREKMARQAFLVLEESGPEALPRPQHVPITLPPAVALSAASPTEAYSYGLNDTLLAEIAGLTGGAYGAGGHFEPFQGQPAPTAQIPLWPWLLIAAVLCHLAAITLQRLDL